MSVLRVIVQTNKLLIADTATSCVARKCGVIACFPICHLTAINIEPRFHFTSSCSRHPLPIRTANSICNKENIGLPRLQGVSIWLSTGCYAQQINSLLSCADAWLQDLGDTFSLGSNLLSHSSSRNVKDATTTEADDDSPPPIGKLFAAPARHNVHG